MQWVEVIGYAASALLVASLAMASVVRLRVLNLLGCLCFVVYGVIIGAWPVAITNVVISLISVWYLVRQLRPKNELGAVPIAADAPYLADFLAARADDIAKYQPTFHGVDPDAKAWLLTRDGLPVGAFVGRHEGDLLRVDLDYVSPSFRDSRLGQWLHGPASRIFREAGIRRLVTDPGTAKHREYLSRVGFHVDGSDMVRDLP